MRVLSLFDGMSCGRIALRELGMEPEVYYASEIDPHAIRQTRHNFPDTVQLGDVERWRDWAIDWAGIDLLLAGSPCQGFSFCGKQLAFDDPRSRLFFVFADILAHVRKANPNVRFLLENVNMKREYLRVISEYCGVFPVRIDSALVSAQNRDRWYWTDIRTRREGLFGELYSDIPQPADRGLTLRDVLDDKVPEKYNVGEKLMRYITDPKRLGKYMELNDGSRKTMCLNAGAFSSWTGSFVYQRPRGYNKGGIHTDKAPALSANAWEYNNILHEGEIIRRLTPTECARLQTIPDWYEWVVSDTQIYRMLGNGWTVDVIEHILSFWKAIH